MRDALIEICTKWREKSVAEPEQIAGTDWTGVYEKIKAHRITGIFYYYLINHHSVHEAPPVIGFATVGTGFTHCLFNLLGVSHEHVV